MQWVGSQLETLRFSLPESTPGKGSDVQSLTQYFLPDPARLFGSARSAFNAALGVVGSSIVVVLVGIFFAASPETYRAGLVTLIPPARRDRVGQVFDEIVNMLRWWLLGQLVTMIMIGISVWIVLSILGIPAALLLGTQAGLFNFIPYLGALVAAVPILLAAIPHGLVVFAWALAAYIVIQTIEGYIVTPLIQDRVVHLPPIATLTAIVMFGALFGAMGIAVATPAAACIRLALLRFYVEDYLERSHPP
jgi:predicted PurR-regulated permease PerM